MLDFINWLAIAVMPAYKNYSMDMCHFCNGTIVDKIPLVLTFFLNCVLAQELWQPDASSWIVKDGGGGSQKKQLHPSPSNGLAWSQHWLLCEEAIAFSSIRSTPFTGMEWLHLKSKLVAMQKKAIVHCQQGMSWSMNIFLFQTSGDHHSMQLTVLITPHCDRPGLTQFRLMES